MAPQNLNEQVAQFRSVIESAGLHSALGYPNARTGFRYTAAYRLDSQMLRNIHPYDRLGDLPQSLSDLPLSLASKRQCHPWFRRHWQGAAGRRLPEPLPVHRLGINA